MVDGSPIAVELAIRPTAKPVPVAELLLDPTRFPADYPAVVVGPKDVARVLNELDGVPAGSAVTPPECAPPPAAPGTVAVQGTDPDSGATLTVSVVRPAPPMQARVDQLAGCSSFTSAPSGDSGEVSEVSVDLPPAPPVDADDTYAVDQTVTSGSSEMRTLTLVALIDDVRVSAAWQQPHVSDSASDSQLLDTLFTDAVLKVRSAAPR